MRRWSVCSCGLVVATAFLFAGGTCGPNPIPGGPSVDEQIAASKRVREAVEVHLATAGDEPDIAAIENLLKSRPELHDVKVVDGVVWAKYAGGERYAVVVNRLVEAAPDDTLGPDSAPFVDPPGTPRPRMPGATLPEFKPGSAAARTRLPAVRTARLINCMGTWFKNPLPIIQRWLETSGYSCSVTNGSVEDMRNITGAGVLYVGSHGGADADLFALWTTTKATDDTLRTYHDELHANKLIQMTAAVDRIPPTIPGGRATASVETHLGVTHEFIKAHWRLADNALVVIDACYGYSPFIRDACLNNDIKAGAYFGWDRPVLDGCSTSSALFFFDRVLGMNEFGPFRDPPQRPYPAESVVKVMNLVARRNGLRFDQSAIVRNGVIQPGTEAQLGIKLRDPLVDVILRPGIFDVRIAELGNRRMLVSGDFGSEAGSVTIGGTPVGLKGGGWTPTLIECEAPAASATGDVIVHSATQVSNPRRITGWDMTFNIHRGTPPGDACANCMWDATYTARVRADAGERRVGPEQAAAAARVTGGSAVSGQNVSIDAISGNYTANSGVQYQVTVTSSFAGSPENIGVCLGFQPQEKYVGLCYDLDVAANTFTMQPTFIFDGGVATWASNPPGGSLSGNYPYWTQYSGNFPGNEAVVAMDSAFTLTAGQRSTIAGTATLQWMGASAISPPVAASPK